MPRMPLRQAYDFASARGLASETDEIRNADIEWRKPSAVRNGMMVRLLQDRGLLTEFITSHWPDGATPEAARSLRYVTRMADQYDAYFAGRPQADEDGAEAAESFEFALEAHLRDFLAKNLSQIEPGLALFDAEGRRGIEFPVDGGRIDLLALDRDGAPVVIELKLGRGRERALGQLLYYMGWIDKNLGRGRSRGIVVANEIPDELTLAIARAPGVSLYRYRMSFAVERVNGS